MTNRERVTDTLSRSSRHCHVVDIRAKIRRMTDGYAGSPTVPRRRLGSQLKGGREATGLTIADVARRLKTTDRTVLRWEAGQTNMALRDLSTLMDMYGINERETREFLANLHMLGRQQGWWAPYSSAVRPTFAKFLGLESGASSFVEYSAIIIPGLLQTEAYMRAIMGSSHERPNEARISKRVEVRQKRQASMFGREIQKHFVIDESCLYRRIGTVDGMHDQLKHLQDVATDRNVTIQVLPLSVGSHASTLGSFSVLQFPVPDEPVACIEMINGEVYADGAESEVYTQTFEQLREDALPEPLAMDRVEEIMRGTHHAL